MIQSATEIVRIPSTEPERLEREWDGVGESAATSDLTDDQSQDALRRFARFIHKEVPKAKTESQPLVLVPSVGSGSPSRIPQGLAAYRFQLEQALTESHIGSMLNTSV